MSLVSYISDRRGDYLCSSAGFSKFKSDEVSHIPLQLKSMLFPGDHLASWRFCSQSMKYHIRGNSFWMYAWAAHKLRGEVEWNSFFFPPCGPHIVCMIQPQMSLQYIIAVTSCSTESELHREQYHKWLAKQNVDFLTNMCHILLSLCIMKRRTW